MKAQDYYEKYKELVHWHPDYEIKRMINDMVIEYADEAVQIGMDRHVKRSDAFMSIIKEQNQKWNAMCRIFDKIHGFSPVKRDGFNLFVADLLPACKHMLKIASVDAPVRTEEPVNVTPEEPEAVVIPPMVVGGDDPHQKFTRGHLAALAMLGMFATFPTYYDL